MPGQFAAATDPGLRRAMNQDCALARRMPDGRVLLVVADGVGGVPGGEVASAETVRVVAAQAEARPGGDPVAVLRAAIAAANDRVRALRREDHTRSEMATTVVAALIGEGEAWVASLGDSRAYRYDGGELEQVTEDDSWVAEQMRAGVLTLEEAERSPRQNVITRGIGVDESLAEEPVRWLRVGPGAMLLVCSDGLYRFVPAETIMRLLDRGRVERVAESLIGQANAAGGPDNIGVALYRQDVDAPTEREPDSAS